MNKSKLLDKICKFKIGDFVTPSMPTYFHFTKNGKGCFILHCPHMVVSRIAEECSGGVQIMYLVRCQIPENLDYSSVYTQSYSKEYVRFNEVELIPFDRKKDNNEKTKD